MPPALEQSYHPKRPISLTILSLCVLTACVGLIAAAIAMLTVIWDPLLLIGGVILFPFPSLLLTQQYLGTFRNQIRGAVITSCLLFLVAAAALLAFVMTLGEVVMAGAEIPWTKLLLPMLAVGCVSCISAWANLRWSQCLKQTATVPTYKGVRFWFSKFDLLAFVAAMVSVSSLAALFIQSIPPKYAENVSSDRAPFGLPSEATQVSFCQGYRGTIACEFTIDERRFVDWVEAGIGSLESDSANIQVQMITIPYSIRRYTSLAPHLNGSDSITIANGLYYEWSKEDRGVYAAFDRTTGRAYYFAHFH